MRFELVGFAALAAGVQGAVYGGYSNATVYETITTTALTTYCPASTTLTQGTNTYTVTEATTLVITDCPCTIVRPVTPATPAPYISTSVALTTGVAPTSVAPVYTSYPSVGTGVLPHYTNTTAVVSYTTKAPSGTAAGSSVTKSSATASAPASTFTGAANKAVAASGAGLVGLIGLAAFIL